MKAREQELIAKIQHLESQLAWFTGLARGIKDSPDATPRIREILDKALKVVGADRWITSPPTP